MLRRAAWTAPTVRRAVPANRPSDDRFHRYLPTEKALFVSSLLSRRQLIAADSPSSPLICKEIQIDHWDQRQKSGSDRLNWRCRMRYGLWTRWS
jgi:hypothetical protein